MLFWFQRFASDMISWMTTAPILIFMTWAILIFVSFLYHVKVLSQGKHPGLT